MKRPIAVIYVRPDGHAQICAWCEDKSLAEIWAESRGYSIGHGICAIHAKRQLDQHTKHACEKITESDLLKRLGN